MAVSTIRDQITKDFDDDERLFHYTSAQGLYGILASNCIWATHYRFLNDSKELQAARASIETSIQRQLLKSLAAHKVNEHKKVRGGVTLRDVSVAEASKFTNFLYDITLEIVTAYVFSMFRAAPSDGASFSDGDLLHWATYGRAGGYALQFNPQKLGRALDEERHRYRETSLALGKVEYGSLDKIPEALNSQYRAITDEVRKFFEGNFEKDDADPRGHARFAMAVGNSFATVVSFFKDEYFVAEREARIIAMRRNSPQELSHSHEVSVRHVGSTTIPYIKLLEGALTANPCAIERIVVGPHPDNSRRLLALHSYLKSRGLGSIDIVGSRVPYVTISG